MGNPLYFEACHGFCVCETKTSVGRNAPLQPSISTEEGCISWIYLKMKRREGVKYFEEYFV
jgi:hypothetical protein